MRYIYHILLVGSIGLLATAAAVAQSNANCASLSSKVRYAGDVFFNYGSTTGAFSTNNRSTHTFGQPAVGTGLEQNYTGGFGFWAQFLLPPFAPTVFGSEGDLEDRVQVDWAPDPLSSAATSYKIYRDGALLATVDGETFSFLDFNVIAGRFYTYEVSGVNTFGEGRRGKNLGFVNPNGVVTGQVKSFAGNPVPGTMVTLTPTIGASGVFSGSGMAFAEYNPAYPRSQFTLSAWVKLGAGNDNAGIFDLGSTISKNWWLHTLPAASGKGVRFGLGNGVGSVTNLDYAFPAATADDWHNVAVTYNGASLLLYVDGELISTAAASVAVDSMTLFFGQKANGTGFYNGLIDEVRFFNRQLSQTDVQMFLNQTVAPDMAGLVNYWKFDEGTGTKTFDLTASKQKLYFCGAGFSSDKPDVVNAGMTNASGFYKIPAINYGAGTTFTAQPFKNFYFNQSLEFNGANQQFVTLTDFDLADSSTVEITVKGFDFASNQCILNKGSHFNLNLNAGNLILTLGSTTHNFGALGMGFRRLSFVIDQVAGSSSAKVTLYKDGAQVGVNIFSGVAANMAGGGGWLVGKNAGGNYLSGLVDEIVFYNTLLPLPAIQAAANVGTDLTNIHLKNYFPFNEGEGTSVRDYGSELTGNGTISGATYSTVAGIAQIEPHLYTPSSKFVTLNPSNTSADGVDFTDQSTIPVTGYVRFDGTTCFQKQVEILVNGKSNVPQIFTDIDGKFSIDLEPGATVRLTPKFEKRDPQTDTVVYAHSFFPAFWDLEKVSSPVAGILFRNQTKRKVFGQMAGNETCRKSVIPPGSIVKVKVSTLNGCYEQVKQLPENGRFTFDGVPPDSVTVAVVQHSNPVIYNFFQNLGGATLDLKEQNDTTDFIYLAPPQVQVSPLPTNKCGLPMLEMVEQAQVTIKVFEEYDGGVCYLDEAKLTISNSISDLSPFDTTMTGGQFKYKFKAGNPNIVPPYLKTLQITAEAHDELATETKSVVVLGKRARQTTFATTSPEMPTLILRDPPGDASTAFMESGETTCQTWSFSASKADNASANLNLSLGADLTTSVGLGAEVELEIEATADFGISTSMTTSNLTTNETETCLTTTKVISTGDNDLIVGSNMGGDVYMGGAVNYIFGITDDLLFDTMTCNYVLDKGLVIFPDGFATTFIYSEYQIKNVVIPNLITIGDTKSAARWQAIIDRNTKLKNEAAFEQNISFDAGVTYEQSTTTEMTKTVSNEWTVEFSDGFSEEFGLTVNGIGLTAGIAVEMTTSKSKTQTNTAATSKTVGFTLADDDIGDNFTVNILKDRAYGTPVFKLVSGQSSCPYEPNTQNRDEVALTVDRVQAVNVPANDAAVFKFKLGNISQSEELRNYLLFLGAESNPLGAVVRANGANLSSPIGYQIPFGQEQEVTVTVERGPSGAYDYEDLEIALFVGCHDERATALGFGPEEDPRFYKAIFIDAHFLEPCSPVNVGFPLQDWVYTVADGPTLMITVDGYDKNDPDLELIRVQYRRSQGDGAWINIAEIPKADLGPVFELVPWATATLQDGNYEIRAVTQCFSGALNPGISKVVKGKFEREAPRLFGTPEPADGVLSRGDEISIRFNEEIRCDQIVQADVFSNNNIGLYDAEKDQLVDAIVSCQGDKIIVVPNVPNRFIENKVMRVEVNNIKDLANNVFVEKSWEFFVDRNPIRWEGGNVKVAKLRPQFVSVTRRLLNDGGQSASFELKGIPSWARVYPSSGIILPGAAEEITIEIDSTLAFGSYTDTLFAIAPEGNEPLIVNARVLCEPPVWDFNPSLYAQTMNFTLQLDIQGALSTDEQDIVAAFIDGQVRGKAYVQYLPDLDKYMAFLTVYGHDGDDTKPLSLEIWDASACLRYGKVLESFQFQTDNVIGTVGTPTVLHTNNLVRRDIPLVTGWNWFSFNLALPDFNINPALASLKDPFGDLVKSKTAFALRGSIWYGSLTGFNNREMFQYRADKPDTIIALGAVIDPASVQIPVVAGWNWIGYIPNYALTVNQALAGLTPLNGDLLKGQTAFAQYLAGFGWFGSMQYMEAPHGYQLKISNPGTLVYPPQPQGKGPKAEPAAPQFPLYWQVDAARYEHSMTLVGMVSAGGTNATQHGHEIGAFVGNELRGSAQAIYIEPLDAYVFFLTTFANVSGEQVRFKLYDATTNKVADLAEKMFFVPDLHQGDLETPVPFSLKSTGIGEVAGAVSLSANPNPFREATTLWFESATAQEVRINVTDAAGRTVLSQPVMAVPGLNSFRWDARDADAGVYFVRLEMAEGTAVRRVVRE